jgi:transglutaminase-like putative cysteine protease
LHSVAGLPRAPAPCARRRPPPIIEHETTYRYHRRVTLSPPIIRLRPALHCRTPILSYALRIKPAQHFSNWRQDPFSNGLVRIVLPEPITEFKVTVDLVADMAVYNPFDFFVEESVREFPSPTRMASRRISSRTCAASRPARFNPDCPLGGPTTLRAPWRSSFGIFAPALLAHSPSYGLVVPTPICSKAASPSSRVLMNNLGSRPSWERYRGNKSRSPSISSSS